MKDYVVFFNLNGARREDYFRAFSPNEAMNLCKDRYPGCVVQGWRLK